LKIARVVNTRSQYSHDTQIDNLHVDGFEKTISQAIHHHSSDEVIFIDSNFAFDDASARKKNMKVQ
jgi:hypothetical protein